MKLTIDELMIGDWVMIKDYPMMPEVKQVKPEHFVRSLVEFDPIPLTAEILEKNNFKKYSSSEYIIFEDIIWYNKGLYIYDKKKIFFDIPECIYVHQLQHILKLIGVDKKIVL